jgi:hypothetical protein
MRESTVFGAWVDPSRAAVTSMEIHLCAIDLVAHWKRCGLTADWVGAFLQYDFEPDARRAATELLSTAMNELIENAAKFCADKRDLLRLAVRHHGDVIVLETQSVADEPHARAFRTVLDELESEDPEELFRKRIERRGDSGGSGLGLLILRKDYDARVAVRMEPRPAERWNVIVQLILDIEEVGR